MAVPAYPPRKSRNVLRLEAITADTRPRWILTTARLVPRIRAWAQQVTHLSGTEVIAVDELGLEWAGEWRDPQLDGRDLAFLQYTSGSTAAPKGVMVSHANLLHNEAAIREAFGQSESSVVVSWLPLYHDMGLIGGVLQPLFLGARCVILSPLTFLQRPRRWLEAITEYGATTSGGPSFAYDLCVRKIGEEELEGLDLSSWNVAFNGSEPVRSATLDRFTRHFAPCGFRREAFYPCYGLAEATLFVAGGTVAAAPKVAEVSAAGLRQGQAVAPAAGESQAALVSCGQAWLGQRIEIVDPDTARPCAAGTAGEIWFSGPSVAQGYWNQPDATRRDFQARLAGEPEAGPFLRTGDLGFLRDGELFVTGRLKDLIILRGRNYYPQDLELAAEGAHRALREGCGAAFSVDGESGERLVVVYEVERWAEAGCAEVIAAVRQAVAQEHEVQVDDLVLVRTGTVPRTTSGKIQRGACRQLYQEGALAVVARSALDEAGEGETAALPGAEEILAAPPADRARLLTGWLRERVARITGVAVSQVDPERPLSGQGLDSLGAVELQQRLEDDLGTALPLSDLLGEVSLAALAARLGAGGEERTAAGRRRAERAAPEAGERFPLTWGQRALWFLERLAPGAAHHNLAAAVRIAEGLDAVALDRAFQLLTARHGALRTTFPAGSAGDHEPEQLVHAAMRPDIAVVDAASWPEPVLADRIHAEAFRPYDLERGPLFRVRLFTGAPGGDVLLLAAHHIVADFTSLATVLRELWALYAQEAGGVPAALPALPLSFGDHAAWQNERLAGPEGERLWAYWQRQLAGELPDLALPADRPRPPVQSYAGRSVPFFLEAGPTGALTALARRLGATPFMVLLAAFDTLLQRYTGQDDLTVGTPTAGRLSSGLAGMVGYFVNPVALRTSLAGEPAFAELVARCRATALAALEHQEYPFALLVERLAPERAASRPPIFQAMLSLHNAEPPDGALPAWLALGEGGEPVRWAGRTLRPWPLARRPVAFDLVLSAAEIGGRLEGSLHYAADLFDGVTARRMAAHFVHLLERAGAEPERPAGALPLLAPAERQQLAVEWNDTVAAAPAEELIHRQFAEQARRSADREALIDEEEGGLTYRELLSRVNQLAQHLRALGVCPRDRVGLCTDRSRDTLVGMLGILTAGAAYVPLDPDYPRERLAYVVEDAGLGALVTQQRWLPLFARPVPVTVCLDADRGFLARRGTDPPGSDASPDDLAYLIYTSGSTGRPKGVMVGHRQVTNFFAGMDLALGEGGTGSAGTWLAVTSISFDISVLELLWTLCRGFRVVLHTPERAAAAVRAPLLRPLDLSLFYFASDAHGRPADRYRLLLEGARFADRHGFAAVWTPERHFHAFGGLYPNPAVTGAAVAAVTQRVGVRAGSVVLPLHDPIRVAEEWSVVDNISGGRVGLSFASGWHADDFVLAPESYATRKEVLRERLETVRRLWRGEAVARRGPGDREVEVRILPRPIQPELPVWFTAAGNPETFRLAGELGARVLTHLLGQSPVELADRIALYREAWRRHGHPGDGSVTLMLHTFVGEDLESVAATVREPFLEYLRTSLDLMQAMAPGQDLDLLSEEERDALLARAFDRYFQTSGLFGTPETCLAQLERLRAIGVDEVACLIDFGIAEEAVLDGLRFLAEVRERGAAVSAPASASATSMAPERAGASLPELIRRHGVTHLQCTPSLGAALALDPEAESAFGQLDLLLLGGEALPAPLAARLGNRPRRGLLNMYGPTETTIWSSCQRLAGGGERVVTIGRPIANTSLHVLAPGLELCPAGVPGELFIGGAGVVRGYWRRPDLTAERFLPDPFAAAPGARLYRTGDRVRHLPDGEVEFLGRVDFQLKLRGHRIELGEIEAVLREHPAVREAVVAVRDGADPGRAGGAADRRLVAYVVAAVPAAEPHWAALDGHARYRLPDGTTVAHVTAAQTAAIYDEIFGQDVYLRHGVTLADGDVVFDVGANIGLFTLYAHRRCREPRVYSFEPIAPTFEVLRANVGLHRLGARVFHHGLSDAEETADFTFYPQMAGLSGRYAEEDAATTRDIITRWLRDQQGKAEGISHEEVEDMVADVLEGRHYACRLRPLSAVIREEAVDRIDLLKVDVERSELRVLQGLSGEDWAKVRQIVIEVHSRELLDQITPLLEARGYALAVDDFIPVGEGHERVFMLYARRGAVTAAGAPDAAAGATPPPTRLDLAALREHLASRLPDYMCPTAFVTLDALPLTPNGKVDRKALPAPGGAQREAGQPYVAPESAEERAIAELWRGVLGTERVGVHDNFFEVGGNSLLLVEVHARLRQALGQEVTLVELMRHPTIAALARHLQARGSGPGAADASGLPPVERSSEPGELPLSLSQQRLWFLHRLAPESASYNVPEAVRIEGFLDVPTLRRSLREIVRRHEALRTTFQVSGREAVQVVQPAADLPFAVVDLARVSAGEREGEMRRRLEEEARRPFDLATEPPLRALLLALGTAEHVLLVTLHHIVADGWSLGVLIRELAEIYPALRAGRPSPLPELGLQYSDFSRWQRRWLRGETLEAEVSFWRRQLAGAPAVLRLPTDRPRPAVSSAAGGTVSRLIPREVTEPMLALVRKAGATPFMMLLAAFQVVLRHHSGEDDLVVGTDVANRRGEEVQKLIGFFVNQLVLRTPLTGNPGFREFLERVRGVCLEAFGHQDLPFDQLVQALNPKRDLAHPVLFQVKVVHQNLPGAALELPGLRLTRLRVETGAAKFDLLLNLWDRADGMEASLEYDRDLFTAETAARLLEQLELVLRLAAAEPDVPLQDLDAALAEAERRQRIGRQKQVQESRRESLKGFRRRGSV